MILCGPSGCGKSTLLRHLKSCLTPHGIFSGEICYQGKLLTEMNQREQAQQIGYVLQSPENQVVTDKVWHELAFGLESLGYDTPTIRRRVAEIAAFFGIENWFYADAGIYSRDYGSGASIRQNHKEKPILKGTQKSNFFELEIRESEMNGGEVST